MRFSARGLFAGAFVALMLATSVPPTPAGCLDDCEEERSACADCPLCSPGRAPVLLGHPAPSLRGGPVDVQQILPTVHPSRIEDHDVFHVPRVHA
jgi:hypothetical protein